MWFFQIFPLILFYIYFYFIFFLFSFNSELKRKKEKDKGNDVVPKLPISSHSHNFSTSHSEFLPFWFGYFSNGGDRIFNQTEFDTPKSLSLNSLYSQKTASNGVLKVRVSLYIRNPVVYSVFGRPKYQSLLCIRYWGPRGFGRFDDVVFLDFSPYFIIYLFYLFFFSDFSYFLSILN